jgi:hypothetical protein
MTYIQGAGESSFRRGGGGDSTSSNVRLVLVDNNPLAWRMARAVELLALLLLTAAAAAACRARCRRSVSPREQGLTLVHFSAQRKRLLWDRGWIQRLFRGCLRGVRGYEGILCVRIGSG